MGTLLDTSYLIALEREGADSGLDEETAIAAVTASELLVGAHRATGRHRAARSAFVEHVLFTVPTIAFTLQIARLHARLWADLAARGRVPGAHDLQIAATAISLGWPLLTLDRRAFDGIPDLLLAT